MGHLSEVSAQATVTSCELANIAADARLAAAGHTGKLPHIGWQFYNVSTLSAGDSQSQIHQLPFPPPPHTHIISPFVLKKTPTQLG